MPAPATCDVRALLDSASCFACTSPGMAQILRVSIWASILSELSGESITVNQLLDRGRCFACISPGEAQILRVQLLCEMNAAISGTPSPTPPTPPVNDPVFDSLTHYWSMDEASGTRVDSKGSINLSESGGAISSGTGIDSSAASWNGTGTANLTTASLGFGSSDIKSVAFWVKVNSFPASFYNFCIGEADPDPSLEIDSHDGGTTGVWVVATIVDGALDEVPATTGTWNLFVATFVDATTWKWSMNGGAFRTVGGQSSGLPSGTTLSVAGIINGANQMNGLIDELMTFNVLLTQGDVTTLWNGGVGKFYRP